VPDRRLGADRGTPRRGRPPRGSHPGGWPDAMSMRRRRQRWGRSHRVCRRGRRPTRPSAARALAGAAVR